MREYERTHPWLTFRVDLRRAPARLWTLLGEAGSKCEHIANAPLRPEVARELASVYLAKGALATTAIEGNTLSEDEVLRHLAGELRLPPSRQYLAEEIDNVVSACNQIGQDILAGGDAATRPEKLKQWNRVVLDSLKVDDWVVPGRLRTRPAVVGRYRCAPAEDCEYLIDRLCEWLETPELNPRDPDQPLVFPILKAVLAHLYFVWIHPFGDGNGRTARLLELQILLGAGVPMIAAHLLSNHYNQTRDEYYRQLDAASKTGSDVVPFCLYAVRGFFDGLRSQLEPIVNEQWRAAYRDYVTGLFGSASPVASRRRQLVLDLADAGRPVPKAQLAELSPKTAAAYAAKTAKTLTRDLNRLMEEGLIKAAPAGLEANLDLLHQLATPRLGNP